MLYTHTQVTECTYAVSTQPDLPLGAQQRLFKATGVAEGAGSTFYGNHCCLQSVLGHMPYLHVVNVARPSAPGRPAASSQGNRGCCRSRGCPDGELHPRQWRAAHGVHRGPLHSRAWHGSGPCS